MRVALIIMKKVFFVIGLICGVSLAVVTIGYVFSSQINYVDLINKKVAISDEDNAIVVLNDESNIVLRYSVDNWRGQARPLWRNLIAEGMSFDGEAVLPDSFTRFSAVSPFPDGVKTIIFATSTNAKEQDYSLFWLLNIGTKELSFFGDANKGVVGNIAWSPKETHYAYYLNTEKGSGEYLTVDNIIEKRKEFTISSEDILKQLTEDDADYFNAEFRALQWDSRGERISFTTNTLEEEIFANWSIALNGTELRRER